MNLAKVAGMVLSAFSKAESAPLNPCYYGSNRVDNRVKPGHDKVLGSR